MSFLQDQAFSMMDCSTNEENPTFPSRKHHSLGGDYTQTTTTKKIKKLIKKSKKARGASSFKRIKRPNEGSSSKVAPITAKDENLEDFLICTEVLEPGPSVKTELLGNSSRLSNSQDLRYRIVGELLQLTRILCLQRETFQTALYCFDSFLSVSPGISDIEGINIAGACVLIACKLEESNFNPVSLIEVCGFSMQECLDLEIKILLRLRFKIRPTGWIDLGKVHSSLEGWRDFIALESQTNLDFLSFRLANTKLDPGSLYSECCDLLDLATLDPEIRSFDARLLVIGVLFIVLGKNFGEWSYPEIKKNLDNFEEFSKTVWKSSFARLFAKFSKTSFESFDFVLMMPEFFRRCSNFLDLECLDSLASIQKGNWKP